MPVHDTDTANHTGYEPGHPWYYKLGGKVQPVKQILMTVEQSEYAGCYADRYYALDQKPEPERSSALRDNRESVKEQLWIDIRGYRESVRDLRAYKREHPDDTEIEETCPDVYVNVSLKYSHLFNDFANLLTIEDLLSHQMDLFD